MAAEEVAEVAEAAEAVVAAVAPRQVASPATLEAFSAETMVRPFLLVALRLD